MSTRALKITACILNIFVLLTPLARAQEPAEKEEPEVVAFRKIIAIEDKTKRLEAMKKYLVDYTPVLDDEAISLVSQFIVQSLIADFPKQEQEILSYAKIAFDTAQPDEAAEVYIKIATSLDEAGILLEKAEAYVERGSKLWEEETEKSVRADRAQNWVLRGRIQVKLKKTAEAKMAFQTAHTLDPELTEAALELARLEKAEGNYAAALEYLLRVVISNEVTPEAYQDLEDVFKKAHPQKSPADLEAMLDLMYEKKYPNSPITVKRYVAPAGGARRAVLAEVFTSASCPPCTAADLAFDAALLRYEPSHFVVLMYHLNIPSLDPMSNHSADARQTYYGVEATPHYLIDGRKGQAGGSQRRKAAGKYYDALTQKIEAGLQTQAAADIKVEAIRQGAAVRVTAAVSDFKIESPSLKLQMALVEDKVPYSGESSIRFHPMVVRSLANSVKSPKGISTGFSLSSTQPKTFEYVFDLPKINTELKAAADEYQRKERAKFIQRRDTIADRNQLSVVVFVQDERTKRVLQTVYAKVKPAPAMATR